MPDIFDSKLKNDPQETIDHQRKLLRGVRTKRAHSRSTQKTEIPPRAKTSESSMSENIDVTSSHSSDSDQHATRPKRSKHVDDYSEVMRHEQPARNPFEAFAAKPLHTFFSSQQSDEQIILVLRKHPITQLKWLLVAIGLAVLPVLFGGTNVFGFLPDQYQFAALIIWYLLLAGFIFESFLTWFFNVYIITDERIIDVDFLSLIYRNISSAKIDNIEDVTATTGGAIRAMFDFGTVQVQTAAEKREFEFEDVPHPNKVTKLINELLLEEEREKIEGKVN